MLRLEYISCASLQAISWTNNSCKQSKLFTICYTVIYASLFSLVISLIFFNSLFLSQVIQDICFSNYSQWVAIVSSRGTCHIYVLSPFGGDVSLQTHRSNGDGPTLFPSLSVPWWSTSSCMINQQPRLPPPPVTLSVVSRIKNGTFGWLNTVSNAATSATGKTSVPSGAIAAVFHNSIYKNLQSPHLKSNSLEHLLVYSPSGHVIQHDLLPSSGVESCDSSFRSGLGPSASIQDEELRVRAEPIQWWDVCRRLNWPEREESFSGITLDRPKAVEVVMDTSDCEDNDTMYLKSFNNNLVGKDLAKPHERPHWYLSNAEVRISSGMIPIWQKSKVFVLLYCELGQIFCCYIFKFFTIIVFECCYTWWLF